MNEQQLADLFSEQIDRLLDGQAMADFQGLEDLSDLFDLGQTLSQVSFQAGPGAQAAFQTQLSGWFGSPGDGLSAAVSGAPKIWLAGLVAVMTLLGAGLGLVGWLNSDSRRTEPQERIYAPVTVELPPTSMPVPGQDKDATEPPATGKAESQPEAPSSMGDTLPTARPSLGDTLPTSTPTPEPTAEETTEPTLPLPAGTPAITGADDAGDENPDAASGDHDRGHGNDPDGYDGDNPGNSSGLPDNNSNSGNPGAVGQGQQNDGGGGSGGGGDNGGKGGGKK
ncbi:MAG: hypothetical protein AB1801_13875 [Chloroflexota bacterium]